jgi:hypothetical protein
MKPSTIIKICSSSANDLSILGSQRAKACGQILNSEGLETKNSLPGAKNSPPFFAVGRLGTKNSLPEAKVSRLFSAVGRLGAKNSPPGTKVSRLFSVAGRLGAKNSHPGAKVCGLFFKKGRLFTNKALRKTEAYRQMPNGKRRLEGL